jgi:hypothetical protein
VKEADLMAFLLKKKEEGYSLIGLEQATKSVSMENFTFPEKCIVLLGTLHKSKYARISALTIYNNHRQREGRDAT